MTATTAILRELFKYGLPVDCVSDNGEEFALFLKLNGVKHVRVALYHAASSGLAECMVQSFKNLLVFLGRELGTRVSLLHSKVKGKVMASEAKQKAARDAHAKLRVLPW